VVGEALSGGFEIEALDLGQGGQQQRLPGAVGEFVEAALDGSGLPDTQALRGLADMVVNRAS